MHVYLEISNAQSGQLCSAHISFLKNFLLMFQLLFPEKILNQQILPNEIFELSFFFEKQV